MELKQQGGKRRGAGRKAVLDKKKQICFYVLGATIIKFGGEDKLKENVNRFIDNFGKEKVELPRPLFYDSKKMDKITHDEPAMWEEVKPYINQFDFYKEEILQTTYSGDLQKIMGVIKNDTSIEKWQRTQLDAIANEHRIEFTN